MRDLPDHSRHVDYLLVGRYVAGTASEAERQLVERWAAASPENQAVVAEARMISEKTRQSFVEIDTDRRWTELRDSLNLPEADPLTSGMQRAARQSDRDLSSRTHAEQAGMTPHPSFLRTRREGGTTRQTWPRGVGGGAGLSIWRQSLPFVAGVIATASAVAIAGVVQRSAARPAAWREYATAAGQRETITLVDGTRFTLAPASRLRIPRTFGLRSRNVELDGEAFFVVAHEAAKPFTVRAANAVATDVGTQFDVRAYPDDRHVRVAVDRGSVMLSVRNRSAVHAPLEAGDLALVDPSGALSVERGRNVGRLLAWRQGGLVFEDTPFRDVVRDVARAFDLEVTVADSALLTHRITSSFGDESADDVLAAVTIAVGADYTRAGRRVVIRHRASAAERNIPVPPTPGLVTTRAGALSR